MGSIGMPEMLVILVIALIIFGPRKLPELGKSLGKSLAEFKRASNDLRNTLEEEIKVEERKSVVSAQPPPVAAIPDGYVAPPITAPVTPPVVEDHSTPRADRGV